MWPNNNFGYGQNQDGFNQDRFNQNAFPATPLVGPLGSSPQFFPFPMYPQQLPAHPSGDGENQMNFQPAFGGYYDPVFAHIPLADPLAQVSSAVQSSQVRRKTLFFPIRIHSLSHTDHTRNPVLT
jgi:hypothetical protein